MNTAARSMAANPARRVASPSRAANRLAHAHGGGHRDAERHHVEDGRRLQRDLVRGDGAGADAAHQQRSGGEQTVLQQEGTRDRHADRKQLPEQLPVEAPESAEHADTS